MMSNVNNMVISDVGSDDDDNGLMEPALAVQDDRAHDNTFDLDIPPTTGNEYLRRVREEAKKCPKIVVSSLDTSQYRQQQTIKVQPKETMAAPRGYAPSASWVKMQLDDFIALRQKLVKFKGLLEKNEVSLGSVTLPQAADAESWCCLCFGRLQLKLKTEDNTGDGTEPAKLQNDGSGTPPLLSILARMDQPTVIKVLEYHVNWLEATGFTHKQGQWFYSLLAVLQKPLTPESCSWLRQLARVCSVIRATLNSPEDNVLHEVNLLICLVAHYFDQTDMADKT